MTAFYEAPLRVAMGGRFGGPLTFLFGKVSIWRRLSLLPGNFRPETVTWLLVGHSVTNQMLASVCPRQRKILASARLSELRLAGSYTHAFCRALPLQGIHRHTAGIPKCHQNQPRHPPSHLLSKNQSTTVRAHWQDKGQGVASYSSSHPHETPHHPSGGGKLQQVGDRRK